MKFLNRNKFFSRHLPIILSVILLMTSAAIYFVTQKSKVSEAAWYSSNWTYRKPITIDHTKVSNVATSTYSSFPVEISVTDPQLKTVTNGGLVASSTGADILFSDSDGVTLLNYEIETYASTTGQLVAWVRIPTLSAASDYTIYEYFGNSSAAAETSGNITGTWETNFKGVWHLPNGTTLTANNTITGGSSTITGVTADPGQIDGAGKWGANTTDAITTDLTSNNSTRTYSIWTYRTGEGGGSLGRMFDKRTVSAQTDTLANDNVSHGNEYTYSHIFSGGGAQWWITRPSANAWHYIVVTYDDSNTTNVPTFYVDGSAVALSNTLSPTGTANTTTDPYVIGNRTNDNARNWAGDLDEFRVSDTIRSADWIKTEYNNQSSPSTFYAYGSLGTNTTGVTANSGGAGVSWYNSAWSYRKPITIDHTKVSSVATTTYSGFPVEISVTDPQLKVTGSGGLVASSTGADIIFVDSNGTSLLNYEIESYTSTTGALVAWVSIPLLTSLSDYTIYEYFGNSSAAAETSGNKTGTWNSNYKAVYHLNQSPTGTQPQLTDSTSDGFNMNTFTSGGSPATSTGQIGLGVNLPATSQFLGTRATSTANTAIGGGSFTISGWIKMNSFVTEDSYPQTELGIALDGSSGCARNYAGINLASSSGGYSFTTFNNCGAGGLTTAASSATGAGVWSYVVGNSNGSVQNLYVNGSFVASSTATTVSDYPAFIENVSALGRYIDAQFDEFRLSNIIRSADWIATEYNNQSSPSTFYSYGSLGSQTRTSADVAFSNRGSGISWYNSNWSYRKPITIDHAKVSNVATTTYSSFPLLISVTDPQLKTVTNGGLVASSTGADIIFVDSNGTSLLNYEIESYASTTGALVAWARIPTLTATADYTIYEYFGNSSAAANTSGNIQGTWDSNYKGVWHMKDGTTLSASDSTSNANNGTINGTPGAIAGQIDGAANFSGSGDNFGVTAISLNGVSYTISTWFNTPFANAGNYTTLTRGAGADHQVIVDPTSLLGVYDSATGFKSSGFNVTTLSNGWHYLTAAASGSSTVFYVDGVNVGTSSFKSSSDVSFLGNYQGGGQQWGKTDELRVSTGIARSADWSTTEYNNQKSPSTFYSYGAVGVNARQNSSGTPVPAIKIKGGVKFH